MTTETNLTLDTAFDSLLKPNVIRDTLTDTFRKLYTPPRQPDEEEYVELDEHDSNLSDIFYYLDEERLTLINDIIESELDGTIDTDTIKYVIDQDGLIARKIVGLMYESPIQ
jgi:hypothetical protein